jgi:hypothetical protein
MTLTRSTPRGTAARAVTSAIADWQAARPGILVVAIDGHGTAGKSTIAAQIARATGAALVHTDDFFVRQPAPIAGQPPGLRPLRQYYDWNRIRAEALEPLRAGRSAKFRRFDWSRGAVLDGVVTVRPSDLILLEGVFSAAPELPTSLTGRYLSTRPSMSGSCDSMLRLRRTTGTRTGWPSSSPIST